MLHRQLGKACRNHLVGEEACHSVLISKQSVLYRKGTGNGCEALGKRIEHMKLVLGIGGKVAFGDALSVAEENKGMKSQLVSAKEKFRDVVG